MDGAALPVGYTIDKGCLRWGAPKTRSMASRSCSSNTNLAAAALSLTCSGVTALGMAITPSWRSTQASATWAGVASWRRAICFNVVLVSNSPPWAIGQ